MDNSELMTTWCRMWSEDPSLAHRTMSGTAVQWSGQTAGLDAVVGPEQQERFVTDYRAEHVNVFTPRVLVDGGDRFAYTWDVRRPGGRVHTGADVDVVRDGLVEQNWTFVAPAHCDVDDPAPVPADDAVLRDVAQRWLQLWGGQVDLAADLVAEDARTWLGATRPEAADEQEVRGPCGLTEVITSRRAVDSSPRVEPHGEPVVDPQRGRVAVLWTAGDDGVGGVDLLAVDGEQVVRAWSLSAVRPFRY